MKNLWVILVYLIIIALVGAVLWLIIIGKI